MFAIAQQYGKVTTRLIHHQNSTNKLTYKVSLLNEVRKALSSNEFAKYSFRCRLMVGQRQLRNTPRNIRNPCGDAEQRSALNYSCEGFRGCKRGLSPVVAHDLGAYGRGRAEYEDKVVSGREATEKNRRPHDPYSLRYAPQVLGAAREAAAYVGKLLRLKLTRLQTTGSSSQRTRFVFQSATFTVSQYP